MGRGVSFAGAGFSDTPLSKFLHVFLKVGVIFAKKIEFWNLDPSKNISYNFDKLKFTTILSYGD